MNITKLKEVNRPSQRTLKPYVLDNYLFSNNNNNNNNNNGSHTYDAYEKDIAMLNVYFESPTALSYSTKQSKTWSHIITIQFYGDCSEKLDHLNSNSKTVKPFDTIYVKFELNLGLISFQLSEATEASS